MNRIRSLFALALALAFLVAPGAQAQSRLGTDYSALKAPQPTEAPGKVEVVEFFWYGCPHCYALEPALDAWVKKLPADVQFRRIPAILSESWAPHARIYYAFEALGVLDRVHKSFFDAIHRDHLNVASEEAMNEWLKKNGIDRKTFDGAVKSFGVQTKAKRAAQLTAAYQVEGVPLIAVQGKHTVGAEQSATREKMLATAGDLIVLARKDLPKDVEKKAAPKKSAEKK